MRKASRRVYTDFNPRPPCGGRPAQSARLLPGPCISIHAPRAGGDSGGRIFFPPSATISIHAPRAGGDPTPKQPAVSNQNFNPRPPCGGRHSGILSDEEFAAFQSTPPVRGATIEQIFISRRTKISIHAPRAGGDNKVTMLRDKATDFNPRPPCGGRRSVLFSGNKLIRFQSTPPVRGATLFCLGLYSNMPFQSTPPVRGATLAASYLV